MRANADNTFGNDNAGEVRPFGESAVAYGSNRDTIYFRRDGDGASFAHVSCNCQGNARLRLVSRERILRRKRFIERGRIARRH